MSFLQFDLGKEFEIQMKLMLHRTPEMQYSWEGDELLLKQPNPSDGTISFKYSHAVISVSYKDQHQDFKRNVFKRVKKQADSAINYGLSLQVRSEMKPVMKPGEVAVLFAEQRTGIVLTTYFNRYTGWGETYTVYSDITSAKQHCSQLLEEDIESIIYDSDYNYLEVVRPSYQ